MLSLPLEIYLHSKKEISKPIVNISSLQEIEFIDIPPFQKIQKDSLKKPRITNFLNIFFDKNKIRK